MLGPDTLSIQGEPALAISFTNESNWDDVMETRKNVQKELEMQPKIMALKTVWMPAFNYPAPYQSLNSLQIWLISLGYLELNLAVDAISIQDLQNEPRCERSWKRDLTVKTRPNGAVLSERDYDAIN